MNLTKWMTIFSCEMHNSVWRPFSYKWLQKLTRIHFFSLWSKWISDVTLLKIWFFLKGRNCYSLFGLPLYMFNIIKVWQIYGCTWVRCRICLQMFGLLGFFHSNTKEIICPITPIYFSFHIRPLLLISDYLSKF